jgi:hypothetical protein
MEITAEELNARMLCVEQQRNAAMTNEAIAMGRIASLLVKVENLEKLLEEKELLEEKDASV